MPWLFLAYPLLVHTAVLTGSSTAQWLALSLLGGLLILPLVSARPWPALGVLLLWAGLCLWLAQAGIGQLFLYAAPVLISLSIFMLFAGSLMPNQEPLVTRIATAMRGPLPPRVRRYTVQVTIFWALLLAAWTLANLLLALLAPAWLWSLFANGLNYGILATVFLGEWLFRCWWLGDDETLTWREYFGKLLSMDYRRL